MEQECYELSKQIDELFSENKKLREALHLISAMCVNPARTMTKLGLEDTVDYCKRVSDSMLNKFGAVREERTASTTNWLDQ